MAAKPPCNHLFRPVSEPFHKVTGQKSVRDRTYNHNRKRYEPHMRKVDVKSPDLTQTVFCSRCAETREITIKTRRQ